jgi:hypothetical protein
MNKERVVLDRGCRADGMMCGKLPASSTGHLEAGFAQQQLICLIERIAHRNREFRRDLSDFKIDWVRLRFAKLYRLILGG